MKKHLYKLMALALVFLTGPFIMTSPVTSLNVSTANPVQTPRMQTAKTKRGATVCSKVPAIATREFGTSSLSEANSTVASHVSQR